MRDPSATIDTIHEMQLAGDPPLVGRADWAERHPWLVHGVTTRLAPEGGDLDLALFGSGPSGAVIARWERLREGLGATTVVHARQVHGSAVRVARRGAPGLLVVPPCDGHLTRDAGVLLTVALADCVPIFLLDPGSRAVGLLHGGWRGVAAGILEWGIQTMWDRLGVAADDLELHLGPSISGPRYEVGPEVFSALGMETPSGPAHLDLRAHLAGRARVAGVRPERIGVSAVCVHDDPRFFSHRAGDDGRHLAVIGRLGPERGGS